MPYEHIKNNNISNDMEIIIDTVLNLQLKLNYNIKICFKYTTMSFESANIKDTSNDMEIIVDILYNIKHCVHVYLANCGVTKCTKCNRLGSIKRLEPIKDYIHRRWMIKN